MIATMECSQKEEKTSNKKVSMGRKVAKVRVMKRSSLTTSSRLMRMVTKASLKMATR